jgi:hypothetical protein
MTNLSTLKSPDKSIVLVNMSQAQTTGLKCCPKLYPSSLFLFLCLVTNNLKWQVYLKVGNSASEPILTQIEQIEENWGHIPTSPGKKKWETYRINFQATSDA